jgi:UDP-2,3-diacylglucosamine pyrophosphatase LpxH
VRQTSLIVSGLIALAMGLGPVPASRAQTSTEGARRIVVLSDLHMGVGRDASGAWHPFEDFRWAIELELFLRTLDAERPGATDLILNGDTFELLQAETTECTYDDATLGCTEPAALARLERVLGAHTAEMAALGAFARAGANRVVLVPGDHDAALLFPTVGARALAAFDVPAERVLLATNGSWRSADGLIHVEHGHQLETRADRFEGWPSPFITQSGRQHLARPWGQRTVQALVDAHEAQYPIIDNLADASAGLRFALSATGATDAGEAAPALLRYLLFRMSWQQFRMDLDRGDVEPPVWNLAAVRAEGPAFLVASWPDDDRFKPLATRALDAGRLDGLVDALNDDDLRALCDQRAAVRRARRRFERILTQLDPLGPPLVECPRTPETTGPRFEYFWQSRDRLFLRHLEALENGERQVAVFVHGHTHLADYRQGNFTRVEAGRSYVVDGFSPVPNAVTPVVINGGAWQRTVTPVMLDRVKAERQVSDAELLETLQPEQLPPCYSFVQIDAYRDRPGPPTLRYWRQGEDEAWSMAGRCGRGISG